MENAIDISESVNWINKPPFLFALTATLLVSGYFRLIAIKRMHAPVKGIQSYELWARSLSKLLSDPEKAEFLEAPNCRDSLANLRCRSSIARFACLSCAYMLAQSRIFSQKAPHRILQRSLDRLLLQVVESVCVKIGKHESAWGCARWMRAAEAASGQHPRTIDVLYKILTNKEWDKFSDVFDKEIRGKAPLEKKP